MTDKDANTGSGDQDDEDKTKSKEEKDFVPRSQMIAALNNQSEKHSREMAEIKGRLEKVEKPTENEKHFTREELKKLVDDGQLTEDQANRTWDNQLEEKFVAKAKKVAKDEVSSTNLTTKVQNEVDEYITLEPQLKVDGSEIRESVRKEFTKLVELGDDPNSLATELKALRMVLGPMEAFKLAKSGRNSHESHEETGGGSGGGRGKGGKSFKGSLSERKRTYYQKQIDQGIYSGWDEVKEELKYSSKRVAA